jgi:Icc protein
VTEITFIHLSDIHIQGSGQDLFMGIDTAKKFSHVLGTVICRHHPTFVVISGDLAVNSGEEESYHSLKEQIAQWDIPILLALGNHDDRERFTSVLLNQPSDQPYYYKTTIADLDIFVLDSTVPGHVHGCLDEKQLEWFRQELGQRPSLLVFHHPVLPVPISLLNTHLLSNKHELQDVIKGKNVVGMLHGHVHVDCIGTFSGFLTAASAGTAFFLDVTESDGMAFIDASSYNLCQLKEGQLTVTPMVLAGKQPRVRHVTLNTLRTTKSH